MVKLGGEPVNFLGEIHTVGYETDVVGQRSPGRYSSNGYCWVQVFGLDNPTRVFVIPYVYLTLSLSLFYPTAIDRERLMFILTGG